MKPRAEYQRNHVQRLVSENGYKIVHMFVNEETNIELERIAQKIGSSKREVLNHLELKPKKGTKK